MKTMEEKMWGLEVDAGVVHVLLQQKDMRYVKNQNILFPVLFPKKLFDML